MASAEVYCKWSNQGDGNRNSGAWSLKGVGIAASSGKGIIPLSQHAERVAWRQAQREIYQFASETKANFQDQKLQIKFWVDQQICPTCQKYLIIDVVAHAKGLQQTHGIAVELYAEVLSYAGTDRVPIKRSTVWPLTVGNKAMYAELPKDY